MTASKSIANLSEADREKFLTKEDRLVPDGQGGLKSPYFHITPGVICDPVSGAPLYDRPLVREVPSVVVFVWGLDDTNHVRLGLVRQQRPLADDPRKPGDSHAPVTFAQVVMGYLESDDLKTGAYREKAEEIGKGKVLNFEVPALPLMNLEPNMFATWHRVVFMQIDLSTVDAAHVVPDEFISGIVYMPISDVLRYIAIGWDEQGASYREGHTLMALMIFFSIHPELFPH